MSKVVTKDDSFFFFTEVEIVKAKGDDDEEVMKLSGVASTMDEDTDGEFLDPKGFDLSYFKKLGTMNWHHLAKASPAAIIGEPTKAEVTKRGLEIECLLYNDSKLAQEVYALAKVLEKNSKTRRLGFSIEGKVVERDSLNEKIVKKARITHCAVTYAPKNPNTFANIVKGEMGDKPVYEEEDNSDESKEKAMDTTNASALKKESVEGQPKETVSKPKEFTKGEVYEKIFTDIPDIDIEKAEKLYKLISKISKMKKEEKITDESLSKAYETLGLTPVEDGEELTKGKDKGEEEEEEEETEKGMGKDDKGEETEKGEDEGEEEEEEEEEEEKPKKKTIKKAIETEVKKPAKKDEKSIEKSEETDILKGISDMLDKKLGVVAEGSDKKFKATGVVLKDVLKRLDNMEKAQEENLSQSQGRKSMAKATERFGKEGNEETLEKALKEGKAFSCSRQRKQVANLLDSLTFANGKIDDEFSKAMVTFEATGIIPIPTRQRIQLEKGIIFVD